MQLLNPGHTATAFVSDLQSFFRPFAEMGGLVERWIEETVGALINRDQERAHKVVTADMVSTPCNGHGALMLIHG